MSDERPPLGGVLAIGPGLFTWLFLEKATVCRGYTVEGAEVHQDRLHPDQIKQTWSCEIHPEDCSFAAHL